MQLCANKNIKTYAINPQNLELRLQFKVWEFETLDVNDQLKRNILSIVL